MFHPTLRRRQWARFVLLILASCAFLTVPVAHAQTPAAPPFAVVSVKPAPSDMLAIGPGLFTFPQIAALLSTPQAPIACDAGLKDRAAYVFLQSRPRAQAQEILGAGLQVEFALNEKTKRVTMVRQKVVAEREARWLKRLARLLQTRWRAEVQKTLALSGKSYVDTDRRARLAQEVSRLSEQVGEPPYTTPPASEAVARQRAERVKQAALLNAEYALPSAQERMLAAWSQANPPDFVSLLQGKLADFALQPVPPQWIENGWMNQTFREGLRRYVGKPIDTLPNGFAAQDYQWLPDYQFIWGPMVSIEFFAHGNLVHQPSEASYTAYKAAVAPQFNKTTPPSAAEKQKANVVRFLNGTLRSQMSFGLPDDTESAPDRIPAPLFVLGQEAVDWWAAEQRDTDRCLKTVPDDLLAPAASARFSDFKTTREMVMELHPRAELWQESGGASEAVPSLDSWAHPLQGSDQWSVREKEAVLLITNRLAFMERPQNVPLIEWINFSRELAQWHEQNDTVLEARYKTTTETRRLTEDFLPYEPLARYTRAVTARRDGRTWRALGNRQASNYHGTDLPTLENAVPAVFLWGILSQKERSQLLDRLAAPNPTVYERFNEGRFPLAQFGDGTLITLAQLLRERGATNADPQNQDYIAYLRSCALLVALHNDPKVRLPGCHFVQASIVFDEGRVVPEQLSSAKFLIAAPSSP